MYDDAVRGALVVLWEAADRICGKRLKALLPLLIPAMERRGHLALDETVRALLLRISAAGIDRTLAPMRAAGPGGRRHRNAHPSAVRRCVPVRTHADWNDPVPGFMDADPVAHNGSSARGSFVQTLTLADVATGWTECAPLLFREQRLPGEVMTALQARRLRWSSPARAPIARTTRPMSSRRTVLSCAGWWAIDDTPVSTPPPNWRGSIAACDCS